MSLLPVLITGCSSGIGRATAMTSVKSGRPTWASARCVDDIADLEAAGCRLVQLDVTDEESRQRAVETVLRHDGAIGALVNNAGYVHVGVVEETSLADVQRQLDTNVLGLMRMCQLVLPAMREQGHGTIVNTSSTAGLLTPPGSATYSMSKYAVEALSDALRLEVHAFGVRVVLIEPGSVRTNLMTTGMHMFVENNTTSPYWQYNTNLRTMINRAHHANARGVLEPQDIATVIMRAINASRPKARYPVGIQARLAPVIRNILGDRLWDALMRTQVSAA